MVDRAAVLRSPPQVTARLILTDGYAKSSRHPADTSETSLIRDLGLVEGACCGTRCALALISVSLF